MSADIMMTLGQAHQLLPGSVLVGQPDTPVSRVHTDTRSLQRGDLFVALRGERFDAHDFLPQAAAAGAVAVLAQRGVEACGLPGLIVPDTRAALGWLASGWRARFQLPLIAVTGSNGKTTVTQMVAAILRAWVTAQGNPEAALSTQGNFNNDIGVPLTLLRLRDGLHTCAVVELGMNHPGEIEQLAALAAPTVALVNNAQREHQEFMHTIEAVARENGSVLACLARDGVAVFPADDVDHTPIWRHLAMGRQVLDFALDDTAKPASQAAVTGVAHWCEASASEPRPHWHMSIQTPCGPADIDLFMAGRHNLRNALAACAAALGAGVPLASVVLGLTQFTPVKGRSALQSVPLGGRVVTLIDDSYNANPDSVRAAIDMLADLAGPHWLVLGDMGEVGDQGPAFHAEVGEYARRRGIEHLWTAGALCRHAADAFGAAARHFPSTGELVAALGAGGPLCKNMPPDIASVLVKGSRFMKMEQVIVALSGGAHAA